MAVHRPHGLDALLKLMADDPKRRTARPVQRRFIQVLNALEKVHARYAICGAVAMGAHGPRRFTEDIDVLVAQAGQGANLNWYPKVSVAEMRTRKV